MVCVLTTSGKTQPTQGREDGIAFANSTRCRLMVRRMVCVLTTSGKTHPTQRREDVKTALCLQRAHGVDQRTGPWCAY